MRVFISLAMISAFSLSAYGVVAAFSEVQDNLVFNSAAAKCERPINSAKLIDKESDLSKNDLSKEFGLSKEFSLSKGDLL